MLAFSLTSAIDTALYLSTDILESLHDKGFSGHVGRTRLIDQQSDLIVLGGSAGRPLVRPLRAPLSSVCTRRTLFNLCSNPEAKRFYKETSHW